MTDQRIKMTLQVQTAHEEEFEAVVDAHEFVDELIDASSADVSTLIHARRTITTSAFTLLATYNMPDGETSLFIVRNLEKPDKTPDKSNYVTVVYRTVSGGAQDQTMRLYPGDVMVIQDLDSFPSPTFTANAGSILVEYILARQDDHA